MKLRYSKFSPYVRKVMVVALELGLADQLEKVDADVWGNPSDIGRDNPLGKVPCLEMPSGEALFDSPVICEYLASLVPSPNIFPKDAPLRWKVLRHQALADGILDASILRRLEGMRPENLRSPDWIERQKRAVNQGLDVFEAEVDELGKQDLNMGHIALGCTLGYLDFRFAEDLWRAGRPRLDKWYEVFAKRTSMQATSPEA